MLDRAGRGDDVSLQGDSVCALRADRSDSARQRPDVRGKRPLRASGQAELQPTAPGGFREGTRMNSMRSKLVLAFVAVLCGWQLAVAQPPPTVWHALGIPQTFTKVRDGRLNRKGNHPAREAKPPLKKLADPENLKSDVPAIKAAAEIKQQEDLAPQKIKAIKY